VIITKEWTVIGKWDEKTLKTPGCEFHIFQLGVVNTPTRMVLR
jgi:hypothetical protein